MNITPKELKIVQSSAAAITKIICAIDKKHTKNETFAELVKRLDLAGLQDLIDRKVISKRTAKEVLNSMIEKGTDAADVVIEKGLQQVSDEDKITGIIEHVISKNPNLVQEYRMGNQKLISWFVGQAMKESKGCANPYMVNEILRTKLRC